MQYCVIANKIINPSENTKKQMQESCFLKEELQDILRLPILFRQKYSVEQTQAVGCS